MTSAENEVDSTGGSLHWGVGRLSPVGLLVEEVGESYRRESQGEGESPSCSLPAFF